MQITVPTHSYTHKVADIPTGAHDSNALKMEPGSFLEYISLKAGIIQNCTLLPESMFLFSLISAAE